MNKPRYAERNLTRRCCLDCGAFIADVDAHTRYHAILGEHARAIALLVNRHPDVYEKMERGRNDNNWSRDAFAEVVVLGGDKQ